MREIMTPEQVAEYLQMNTHTIYRLIHDHKLAAIRIGRAYRIPKEDLDNFIFATAAVKMSGQAFRGLSEIGERNQTLILTRPPELEEMDEERKAQDHAS